MQEKREGSLEEAQGASKAAPVAAIAASAFAGCLIGGVCWAQLAFSAAAAFAVAKGLGSARRWAWASWACLVGLVFLWSLRCATALLAVSAWEE